MLSSFLTDLRTTTQRPLRAAAILVALFAMSGCQSPPEVGIGQPVTQGTLTVTVLEIELAHLDLEGPTGAVQTQDPLLLVRLSLTNSGADGVRYDLGWETSASTQAQAPLLFVDPGPEAEPTTGTNVPAALLNTLDLLDDPITEPTTIAAGETREDILLFQRPPAGATNLVLSLPPAMFGPEIEMPAYVRIPYPSPEPTLPHVAGIGESVTGPGYAFVVRGAEVVRARLVGSEGEGFSQEPTLRIDFTLTNTGDATIQFVPTNASNAMDPPALIANDGEAIRLAEFDAGVNPVGQIVARRQIGPGESLDNFLLFERPPAEVSTLRLIIPGKRFGSTGLVRAELPYAFTDPPQPPELTPRVIEAPAPAE